jgi:hypothetical protein
MASFWGGMVEGERESRKFSVDIQFRTGNVRL